MKFVHTNPTMEVVILIYELSGRPFQCLIFLKYKNTVITNNLYTLYNGSNKNTRNKEKPNVEPISFKVFFLTRETVPLQHTMQ